MVAWHEVPRKVALPRSGFTEQPRVLTLGSGVSKRCPESGTRCWALGGITREQPKRPASAATREALRTRRRIQASGVME
jgi:hypothetical protein